MHNKYIGFYQETPLNLSLQYNSRDVGNIVEVTLQQQVIGAHVGLYYMYLLCNKFYLNKQLKRALLEWWFVWMWCGGSSGGGLFQEENC